MVSAGIILSTIEPMRFEHNSSLSYFFLTRLSSKMLEKNTQHKLIMVGTFLLHLLISAHFVVNYYGA